MQKNQEKTNNDYPEKKLRFEKKLIEMKNILTVLLLADHMQLEFQ